ncbi:YobI family P-loop NTPase, partial [Snodgrassella alvi]|uniref:YobI family P-loop NTPase n=2 Tax=Snodgrassella alvi TaxID=1196083 RepID=UPI00117AD2E0
MNIKSSLKRRWDWIRNKIDPNKQKDSADIQKEKKYQYQKLTPYTDVELDAYQEAFDYVFEHEDVRNVAISGAYGSGKSSLIESYKEKIKRIQVNNHQDESQSKKQKFLHISLAHFRSENNQLSAYPNDKENSAHKTNELAVLEAKILNQLIHQIPAEQIPQSNFAVKRIISKRDLLGITISSIIFILLMLDIIFPAAWKAFVLSLDDSCLKDLLLTSTTNGFILSCGVWNVALFAIFLNYVIKMQKHKNIFKKLKLQGNEIEIVTECSDSFFDRYLNEVVYIFANANVDVIVFEDIDRFENRHIFERLREINTLANNQLKQYQKKHTLRFFYLLRDDIFSTKDRTKFFDFIIPVIPVVDGSNSYDQLIKLLEGYVDNHEIDKGFLEGISLYIDDMRLLKNICNEFHLYFSKLNNTELNANKMFALITYKNLFPLDFACLQLSQGFVFTAFNRKIFYINTEKEKLLEKLNALIELKKVEENNHGEKIESLQEEISNIRREILFLQNKKLKCILNKENIDKFFSECLEHYNKNKEILDIETSPYLSLLKYLIRNGYIDETYADYMTYFYPNSLTIADKTFLRSVTDEVAKEYEYKLNNPELITGKLLHQQSMFEQPEVLNIDLVNYLLGSFTVYTYEVTTILNQLVHEANLKFINAFWPSSNEKNLERFVQLLNKHCPQVFMLMLNSTTVSNNIIKDFSIKTLYFSSQDIIATINTDNHILSNYIANIHDYLIIDKPDVAQLIKQFIFLEIKFKEIEYKTANKDLFNVVYQNDLYELNFTNIQLMLATQYTSVSKENIIYQNYTSIMKKPDSPLAKYVALNIDAYIHIMLANCEQQIKDDETDVLQLLNHKDISEEHKLEYIDYLYTTITRLDKVKNTELWQKLLYPGKLDYNEENILCYFQHTQEVDEPLIEFINSNEKALDFKPICNDENVDVRGNFFAKVIINQNISDNKYGEILSTLKFWQVNFNIDNISRNKFKILIDKKIIGLKLEDDKSKSINTLQFIRSHYDEEDALYFIQNNFTNYLDLVAEDTELFDYDETLQLVNLGLDDEDAIRLLKCTDKPVSVVEHSFLPAVMAYVLEHNFATDDLADLISKYQQYDADIQALIKQQVNEHIESVSIEQNTQALEFIRVYCDKEAVLDYLQKNIADYADLITEDTELFDYDETLQLVNLGLDDEDAIRLLKCTDKPVSVVEHSFLPAVMAYVLEHNFATDDLADLISKY